MLSISIKSTKAQAWYMDFAIAMLLFGFTLAIYLGYTENIEKRGKGNLDILASEVKSLSSSLMLEGYPSDWNSTSIISIGIAKDQKLNATKLKRFKSLNYAISKTKLGTTKNFIVFFLNDANEVMNINGVCGIGHEGVDIIYNTKSAYYYQDESDSFLKNFMNQSFKADIYFDTQLGSLMANLDQYQMLVMEHPAMTGGNYNNYKETIENFTAAGGLFLISGELTTAQGQPLAGVEFYKKAGQSQSDREAIVNNTDEYLSLSAGQNVTFAQAYYVNNLSTSSEFRRISTFMQDGNNAISKWNYGNGTVYFFSDFDTSYFNGNFTTVVEQLASSMAEGTCFDVNITGLSLNNLVKNERYLGYKGKIIKMVVYLWE